MSSFPCLVRSVKKHDCYYMISQLSVLSHTIYIITWPSVTEKVDKLISCVGSLQKNLTALPLILHITVFTAKYCLC